MILAESLSFSYPDSPRPALRGINLRLEPGSLICLAGANGSGKTTLLQVLGGLLRPEGKLEFKLRRNPPFCRYLPQNPELYILGATVEEDLLLGLPDTISRNEALAWLERLDLAQLRAEPVHTLSYGQKRKLCLASALAAQPDLLLLDEPFAGLDFQAALQLRQVLQANRQAGLIQIVSSHDLDLLADLTDQFILLRQGQILAQGRPDQVEPYLEAAGVRPPCHWRLKQQKPLWQEPE